MFEEQAAEKPRAIASPSVRQSTQAMCEVGCSATQLEAAPVCVSLLRSSAC
jgi:hypothetical protein